MSMRAFLLFSLALAACGPKVTSQATVKLDPLPADHEVKVFASDLPTCEYEQVGLIGSDDLKATLERARQMGADGVIGTVLATGDSAGKEPALCGTPSCPQFNAVAIRFTDPACTH